MANNRYITGDIANIPAPKKIGAAPLVQAVEPIKGDWTQNNNWAFLFDTYKNGWPLINNPSIYSIAQCPVFRGPPRIRGILLTRDDIYVNDVLGSATPGVKARITYGSGGLSQQMLLDWGPSTIVNLPASNIVVEAIVTGSNNNGGGLPILGGILGASFSNELIPKVGFTTLTESKSFGTPVEIPPFATGFILGSDGGLADTEVIRAYASYDDANPVLTYEEPFTAQNLGQINWLPTSAAYLVASVSAPIYISWVLSV